MTGIKARPTMYKGIQMRSRLEADFAAFLDRGGVAWEYEPTCFAGPAGQWLPDFRVTENEKRIYVEVKPGPMRVNQIGQIDQILERMTVAWLSEPAAVLHLAIWQFGKPRQSFNIMGFPGSRPVWPGFCPVWWYHEGAEELSIWPGMSQGKQIIEDVGRGVA